MLESEKTKEILLSVSKSFKNFKVFRNNVGTGWVGQSVRIKEGMLIQNPRPLKAGLCEGSSDYIGWTIKEITPDMIGKKIAIFTAIEFKAEKGLAKEKQLNFIKIVRDSGGCAGIVKNENDLIEIIK